MAVRKRGWLLKFASERGEETVREISVINHEMIKTVKSTEKTVTAPDSQIKGGKQLDSLADALELLSAKIVELEKDCEKKDEKISELEKKVDSLESKLGDSVDELEQYCCRNCFLLHGVWELEGKNMNNVIKKTVKEEMDIDIWEEGLDQTHFVGNPKFCKVER